MLDNLLIAHRAPNVTSPLHGSRRRRCRRRCRRGVHGPAASATHHLRRPKADAWSGLDDGFDPGRVSFGRIVAETIADVVDPVDVVVLALVGGRWPLDGGGSGGGGHGTVHEEGLVQGEVEGGFGFVGLEVQDGVDGVLDLAADVLVKVETGGRGVGVGGVEGPVELVEVVVVVVAAALGNVVVC